MQFLEKDIDLLVEQEKIKEVMYTYVRATDRLDWDLLKTCFHPDIDIDYGVMKVDSAEKFVEFGKANLESKGRDTLEYESCSHPLFNVWVQFATRDKAMVESYTNSVSQRWVDGNRITAIMSGRYLDRFEKRDGAWKISRHHWMLDQYFEVPQDMQDPFWHSADANRGAFGKGDPLYAFMADMAR